MVDWIKGLVDWIKGENENETKIKPGEPEKKSDKVVNFLSSPNSKYIHLQSDWATVRTQKGAHNLSQNRWVQLSPSTLPANSQMYHRTEMDVFFL